MIASFGSKKFEVSHNKIMTPDDISFSEKLDFETQERAGDKPAIYVKGLGALETSFSVKLDARFVDVDAEIAFWLVKMRTALPDVLALGSRIWGAGKALLTSVSVSDIVLLGDGTYASAAVSLAFTEYVYDGTSDSGASATTGAGIKAARIMLSETMVST